MIKHKCKCGRDIIIDKYTIHIEGSLTFRDYNSFCINCSEEITVRDLNESDLLEQEYLF